MSSPPESGAIKPKLPFHRFTVPVSDIVTVSVWFGTYSHVGPFSCFGLFLSRCVTLEGEEQYEWNGQRISVSEALAPTSGPAR
eukprot:490297-Prorocentrum_minimum.AAC.2